MPSPSPLAYHRFDSLSWLSIQGADRGRVLNNLCTAEVGNLALGEGCEAFLTDVRGKTFAHLFVYADEDSLQLLSVPGQGERIAAQIDRYIIREEARIEDHSGRWSALLLPGAAAAGQRDWAESLVAAAPPRLAAASIGGADIETIIGDATAYQVPWTGPHDWLLRVAADRLPTLESWLQERGWQPADEGAFHAARIANRFPWFGIDFDDTNLPQEVDRDGLAINFTKGCYLGQETVARLDALGQVQKKIVLWQFEGTEPPPAGTELTADSRVVGRVTSAALEPSSGRPIALGMARRSHFDPGSRAESPAGPAIVAGASE